MNDSPISIPPDQKQPQVDLFPQNQADQNSPVLKRPIILGDFTLASPTTQTTIGANGAATALTANPVGYLTFVIGNVSYQIPYYNLA